MVDIERVVVILQDPWTLHADALEEMELGELRNAAEKAWGATKRATDAPVLARAGEEPRTTGQTNRELRRLGRQDQRIQELVGPYFTRAGFLHGQCFYDGMGEPVEAVDDDIRGTANYIQHAQELAAEV